MQSIKFLNASDGTANASLMTVQTLRSPGATTIIVNTVTGVHATGFHASMGAPHTFTDPVTGETITLISDATAVDFAGHINAGQIIIDAIAPGYVDTRGSAVGDIVIIRPTTDWSNNVANVLAKALNDDGSFSAAGVAAVQPLAADFIQSGGVWSSVSGLNGAMTALTCYQAGYQGSVATLASRAFTLNKDTYVDVLRTLTGFTNVFTLVYTEVANGAASPALAANSIRLAKVVTGASTITSVTQLLNSDSLGNLIYPTGAISAKNIQNPVKFSTYRNAAYSMPNTGFNKVPFDAKVLDSNNNVDIVTNIGRFTAPVSGAYWFSFNIATVIGGTDDAAAIYKNGSIYRWGNESKGGGTGGSFMVPLLAGEYVEVFASVDNLALNVGNAPQKTWFDGYLMAGA